MKYESVRCSCFLRNWSVITGTYDVTVNQHFPSQIAIALQKVYNILPYNNNRETSPVHSVYK